MSNKKMESMIQQFKLFSQGFQAPPGEIYCGTEAHKGELGFYLISDGSANPGSSSRIRPCVANRWQR